MARLFIDRPIFAIVVAILIALAGALSIFRLPIEQYPAVAPPSIQVSASYPGASAQTVENTVAQVIEQQMNGLDHLLYLATVSDDFGQATTTLTFEAGTDPDVAQVQVQNKLQLALPLLPAQVQQAGIRVTKSSSSFLLLAAFVSSDPHMTKFDIADYVASHVQDPVSRLDGVGNLNLFGTQYAMRIWLNANQLNSYSLTPQDVTAAIQAQNVQISGGQLGGTPAPASQRLTASITEATLLRTPEQFGAVLLKVNPDGSQVRIRDVARVELGAENFNVDNKYNGRPAAAIGIQLATGANALATADAVRARIEELSKYFPPGLSVVYPYDTTPFVRVSISEVVKTLFEGVALVFLVMYLFLQNLRATLVPTLAVPVVLLGTFGVMAAAGFTINTLTMFGLVLAIGLLVDDAIVVVENIERLIVEEKLSAREATRKAMGQITGALIGVAMVLSAVFVPVAFSSGTTGAIYRQFSLTIVAAMALSVFVALSLTPALCGLLLRPRGERPARGFFAWFNRQFDRNRDRYVSGVRYVIARSGRALLVYGAAIGAVVILFLHLPTSFLPDEDQGYVLVQVQGPPGGTQGRTAKVLDDVSDYLLQKESRMVDAVFQINGYNFAGRGQNQGLLFVHFRDWSERKSPDLGVHALMARLAARYASYPEANIIPVNPPAIRELGTASGFDMELEDRGGVGHEALMKARDQLIAAARKDPTLALVRANGLDDNPTFTIDVDREKASALGVAPSDIDQSFSIAWGSRYINNFLDTDSRIKKVYAQADAPFRLEPEDLRWHFVRNSAGSMVPLTAFATGRWTYGSPKLERYNGVSSVEIQGQPAAGYSTGESIATMERLAAQLPTGIGFEWTGLSLQEELSGAQAPWLYAISIVVVFLSLAALYESWFIPISVIMVVPLGVLGALGAAFAFGMENDVYFQVGLLTTIGLSAKNAILIVEFARNLNLEGRSLTDAALEAAKLRLRPIVMTSMAFMLGVLPLALATGAGSASRNAIGTGVIGGMLTATFLAPFLVPMFFVVIGKRFAVVGAVAVAALSVSGCSLEPAYTRPDSLPAYSYPTGSAYAADAGAPLGNRTAPADLGWREFFSDPYLQQLVETGLRNNRDLRIAMLTVEALQAQYRINTAALFPNASAYADRDRSRTPADLSRSGVAGTTGSYAIGASLSWEIDFFGKLRSLRHSALEQYLASIEGRRAAQLLIVSEVAQDYLALLACDELLRVTDQTLEAASESYRLVKLQFDVGNGSELDVRQAQSIVEQARANRAAQVRARAQAENALMQLLGVPLPPGREAGRSLTDQNIVENLPAGLPSELLARRPDVLQAEALIRAANADIGAARAAFFPNVSLTGSGGTASAALDGLFGAGSAAWSVAPAVLTTLFDAGANRANLDVARVRTEIAIAQYQRTVHAAFREVADGLAASGTFHEQLTALEQYIEAQRRRLELAVLLYRNGESSYLDVLTAQTDLYDAQLALVETRLERLTNLVELYRALGGGWHEHTARRP